MRHLRSAKLLSLILVVGLSLGLAWASAAGGVTLKAKVVDVNLQAGTITFQESAEDGPMKLPVEKEAVKTMQSLEPGDQVTLTCRQSEDGQLVAVTAIAKA